MANKVNQRDFTRGFCAAVADLVRSHDEPTIALDLLTNNGITPKMVKKWIDEYDKREIYKLWVEQ